MCLMRLALAGERRKPRPGLKLIGSLVFCQRSIAFLLTALAANSAASCLVSLHAARAELLCWVRNHKTLSQARQHELDTFNPASRSDVAAEKSSGGSNAAPAASGKLFFPKARPGVISFFPKRNHWPAGSTASTSTRGILRRLQQCQVN